MFQDQEDAGGEGSSVGRNDQEEGAEGAKFK